MSEPKIVSREEWLTARRALMEREKELTRARDRLAAERRALPRVRVDKDYRFEGPDGSMRLVDLFGDRSQLLVYHFMFDPSWEAGCKSCSFVADSIAGAHAHLAARDVALVLASRAPLRKLQAFRARMGWPFLWVSAGESDFNYDFHVSFTEAEKAAGEVEYNFGRAPYFSSEGPGISAFVRDPGGAVFHTYSAFARALDDLMITYRLLDLAPKGRDEGALAYSMAWVRHHDRYDPPASAS